MRRKKKEAKQEQSIREEVVQFLRDDFKSLTEATLEGLLSDEAAGIVERLEARAMEKFQEVIQKQDRENREIKVVFPAWGDIERVVRETMGWDTNRPTPFPVPLRSWVDCARVNLDPRVDMTAIELPEAAVPLAIMARGIPETARLNVALRRTTHRETRVVQIVTGTMFERFGIFPFMKAVVSDSVEIRVEGHPHPEEVVEVLIQYVGYQRW